jgi:hypothetical protein
MKISDRQVVKGQRLGDARPLYRYSKLGSKEVGDAARSARSGGDVGGASARMLGPTCQGDQEASRELHQLENQATSCNHGVTALRPHQL